MSEHDSATDGAVSRSARRVRHLPIEETEVFRLYVEVADRVWELVLRWPQFARDTLGQQLVRAADRIGATLVEGDGRYSDAEAAHLFVIARGSARETRFWIERAATRNLVSAQEANEIVAPLIEATKGLNGLIRYRRAGKHDTSVRETRISYKARSDDPFIAD